jgi:hypothetical protein
MGHLRSGSPTSEKSHHGLTTKILLPCDPATLQLSSEGALTLGCGRQGHGSCMAELFFEVGIRLGAFLRATPVDPPLEHLLKK